MYFASLMEAELAYEETSKTKTYSNTMLNSSNGNIQAPTRSRKTHDRRPMPRHMCGGYGESQVLTHAFDSLRKNHRFVIIKIFILVAQKTEFPIPTLDTADAVEFRLELAT